MAGGTVMSRTPFEVCCCGAGGTGGFDHSSTSRGRRGGVHELLAGGRARYRALSSAREAHQDRPSRAAHSARLTSVLLERGHHTQTVAWGAPSCPSRGFLPKRDRPLARRLWGSPSDAMNGASGTRTSGSVQRRSRSRPGHLVKSRLRSAARTDRDRNRNAGRDCPFLCHT